MTVPTMDKLPRVPENGENVDEKIFSDLYIRTSWVDANVALDQIKKVSFITFNLFLNNKKVSPRVHRRLKYDFL